MYNFNQYLNSLNLSKSSQRMYRSDVKAFTSWLQDHKKTSKLDYMALREYVISLKEDGIPTKSIRRAIAGIKHYYKYMKVNSTTLNLLTPASLLTKNVQVLPQDKGPFNLTRFAFAGMAILLIVLLSYVQSYKDSSESLQIQNYNPIPVTSINNSMDNKVIAVEPRAVRYPKGITITLSDEGLSGQGVDNESPLMVLGQSTSSEKEILKSSGTSYIPQGSVQAYIISNQIHKDSLLFVTPTTNTLNEQLFVSHQEEGLAVVSITNPPNKDINFNWMVVNTEVYQSIH